MTADSLPNKKLLICKYELMFARIIYMCIYTNIYIPSGVTSIYVMHIMCVILIISSVQNGCPSCFHIPDRHDDRIGTELDQPPPPKTYTQGAEYGVTSFKIASIA